MSDLKTSARVIADSIWDDHRLTTMEVTLHRFVLAEFNTHRVFSRNSASSRAIPVQKQLDRVLDDPAWPLSCPREKKGMQGGSELEDQDLLDAQNLIVALHDFTTSCIQRYINGHPDSEHRLHKSVLNRYLEPWMWHTIVVTSTDWDNFFGLRCSPLAQPEIRAAAELMQTALTESTPVERRGTNCTIIDHYRQDWHLPYISDEEREFLSLDMQKIISVARCARVSSLHAGDHNDYEQDVRLYTQLVSAEPMHASPLEHVALPCDVSYHNRANFSGWHQMRHMRGILS
jgi:thymidylate synthase ThyX